MTTTSTILASGANTVPFELREKLCKAYCVNNAIQPSVSTNWSIDETDTVGSVTYYSFKCIATVTYRPKGACANCGYVTNTFVEYVTFAVPSTSAITLTSSSDAYTVADNVCENNCNTARGIKHIGSLTLTVA